MTIADFTPSMILAILPEILLLLLAVVILAADLILPKGRRGILGWLGAAGLAAILVAALFFSRPEAEQGLIFGGMLRHDWLAFTFKVVFLFSGAVACLLSLGVKEVHDRGEYYALLVFSTLGMTLMASAADLIMLYLSIESTSIPLYVLAGFIKRDEKSTESGMKYFLFGALTSTVMLYGFSLLYGFAGETNLYRLASIYQTGQLSPVVLVGTALLVLVGFGFKVAAVPFHFWTPDVYEGAPTPITAFVSTASKAAGFAVLLRVFLTVFAPLQDQWVTLISILAVLTMTLGNLLAIPQRNIKRLLAYSSIAQAGYVLIGVASVTSGANAVFGPASALFYLGVYMLTNIAAFVVVVVVTNETGTENLYEMAGLSKRSFWLALGMMLAMLSLGGVPPLAGFFAKFYVFQAAVGSGLVWLAIVGVLNAILGLYYYLIVIRVIFVDPSQGELTAVRMPLTLRTGLFVTTAGILILGVLVTPWYNLVTQAAMTLVGGS